MEIYNHNQHCMVDVETLGRSHDAAIVQLGWCFFDLERTYRPGCRTIKFESAMKHGTVTADTVLWWMNQSYQARQSITHKENDTLEAALAAFNEEVKILKPKHFWAHATFDFPILTNAYKATGVKNPIGFLQCRDIRTLDMLARADLIAEWPEREGTHHDAMDDAVHQAKCVQMMLGKIGFTGE